MKLLKLLCETQCLQYSNYSVSDSVFTRVRILCVVVHMSCIVLCSCNLQFCIGNTAMYVAVTLR